jgi:cyclopropane-fatty-acyl-phospholipid synthase
MSRFVLSKVFGVLGKSKLYRLKVVFSNGSEYTNYTADAEPEVTIHFKTLLAQWWTLMFFFEGFFEKYIDGEIDLEGIDPILKIGELGHVPELKTAPGSIRSHKYPLNPTMFVRKIVQEWTQSNWDRARAKTNAEFHYNIHPALFEHMLGGTVGYSEGYWTDDTQTLDQAKHNNYEYVCRKLDLKPGDKVLEVGSGWGFMPIYMAKKYGAQVTVYNPARRQNEYMRERFKRHGVEDKIRLVEGDHRDIENEEAGSYDKFVTIGVHEHHGLGLRMYDSWWKSVEHILKPGGTGLISTTSYMPRVSTNFLTLKYVFPGGNLPSLPEELLTMHRYNMTLVDVENLWPHYHRTAEHWKNRFREHWEDIRSADPGFFTERFRRRWSLYVEATTETFADSLDASHILFTKGRSSSYYSWTREKRHEADFRTGDQDVECYR